MTDMRQGLQASNGEMIKNKCIEMLMICGSCPLQKGRFVLRAHIVMHELFRHVETQFTIQNNCSIGYPLNCMALVVIYHLFGSTDHQKLAKTSTPLRVFLLYRKMCVCHHTKPLISYSLLF
jgi:hypothetical protein